LPSTPHSPLALLESQTSRYLIASIHSQKYLLHPRDILTLPKLASKPAIGSTLQLTRITEVGSRDFALKAPTDQRLTQVVCTMTVLEHTTSPMEIVNKKKRRKGYQKQVRSRSQYTRLRVGEIELVGEG
ncbi:ribosomal protein L21-like protein, partial [Mrakia frigida]|uniref:mitochondrial 54S ribosomal protein bL21m MRPL49 n=1 Tax=Mrakia frigida TaxID=29902 RepID=UPI003FCC1EAD